MSDLHDIPAATMLGQEVSLYDVLTFLKQHGKMAFLHEAVEGLLIKQAIMQQGITVSNAELQHAFDAFRRHHSLYKAAETRQWLQQHHLTMDDLESRIAYDVATTKLREQVTTGKIERYFAEHKATFDTACIAHIVVPREGMASEIISQITEEDADFATLARQHSTDAASKAAGGYVGIVHRKVLHPAVEAAIFAASSDTIVGPVKTDLGYHVIQVQALYPAQLNEPTRQAIQELLYGEWLRETVRAANITFPMLQLL